MFQDLGHQLAAQLATGTWADLDTFWPSAGLDSTPQANHSGNKPPFVPLAKPTAQPCRTCQAKRRIISRSQSVSMAHDARIGKSLSGSRLCPRTEAMGLRPKPIRQTSDTKRTPKEWASKITRFGSNSVFTPDHSEMAEVNHRGGGHPHHNALSPNALP